MAEGRRRRESGRAKHSGSRELRNCLLLVAFASRISENLYEGEVRGDKTKIQMFTTSLPVW